MRRIVLTTKEGIELFEKTHHDKYILPFKRNSTHRNKAEWAYYYMGWGRVAWGVQRSDIAPRCDKLLAKVGVNDNTLLFTSIKESYPPVFILGEF